MGQRLSLVALIDGAVEASKGVLHFLKKVYNWQFWQHMNAVGNLSRSKENALGPIVKD
jgi:hypothetical protein